MDMNRINKSFRLSKNTMKYFDIIKERTGIDSETRVIEIAVLKFAQMLVEKNYNIDNYKIEE